MKPSNPPVEGGVTDIGRMIDVGAWSNAQKLAVLIAALAIVLDGFANQALALSIPMLMKAWHVERSAFLGVTIAGFAGMAVGTVAFGVLGDRLGRRPVLIGCVLLFAAPTLAIAFINGLGPLLALRLVGGLGLGGCMPNATALLAELTPARSRSLAITSGIVGIPVGGTLGGLIGASVSADHWQALYLIAGLCPLVIALLMIGLLPESPRFLAIRPQRKSELVKTMRRFENPIDPALPAVDSSGKRPEGAPGVMALFSKPYLTDTLGLWSAMFFTLLSVYGVVIWLPSILGEAHYPGPMTSTGLTYFNLGGIAAALGGAACFNRFGSRNALAVMALGAILASAWLYAIPLDPKQSPLALLTALTLQGGFINGVQTTLYALAAFVYGTEMRSAGVGWAVGIGRVGAIICPLVGDQLIHLTGANGFFGGFGLTMCVSLASLLMIRRHIPGRNRVSDKA
ncbi:MAG TPA: MFS transporter [Caulobacteraceae bacterium]|nr:MFS transporter [Caulobacteraceae bacterium]